MIGMKNEKCEHLYYDGTGHYCRLIPMANNDYPHKHWRVFCFGNRGSFTCEAEQRGLLKKSNQNTK